jgi:seryl-tRNA synthetase
MLDVNDFITERGGNPEKIKYASPPPFLLVFCLCHEGREGHDADLIVHRESQRRRGAPVEIVDDIIALWDDHRKTLYAATQLNSKINETQKAIGMRKKVRRQNQAVYTLPGPGPRLMFACITFAEQGERR